ncbi:MAG: DUF11 domain-containing protein [Xanthomonadales bacterium]|nr:DUF11 domain-containing protein [Xanthomonadales bacterium]
MTCTIAAGLAPAASAAFTIPVTPTISAVNGNNTAVVSGGGDPTCPGDPRCDDTVLVPINAPILNVTKTATPNPFVIGQPAAYVITVSNSGAAATTAPITITDNLPVGISLQSATGAGWGCVGTSNLSCTYGGVLGAGASTVLTLNVIVGDSATDATNTAVASGGGDPGCPAAPRCDDTVVVPVTRPDLALVKTHSGNFIRGQSGGLYTLTVSNVGSAASSGLVTVVDTLPVGLTADSIGGTGWSCVLATLTCTRPDPLAAGASYPPITIGVTVDAAAPDNLLNTAVVNGGGDTDPSNNNDDDPVTVINGGPATPLIPVPVDSRFALLLLALAMWGMALVARRRVV